MERVMKNSAIVTQNQSLETLVRFWKQTLKYVESDIKHKIPIKLRDWLGFLLRPYKTKKPKAMEGEQVEHNTKLTRNVESQY